MTNSTVRRVSPIEDDVHGPPQRRATHNPDEAVRRLKRWAPKVTTGCATCRTRRVKCDEARPVCKRCKNSRRKCEYDASAPSSSTGSPESILGQPAFRDGPIGIQPSSQERRIFHLMRTTTARQVSGGIKVDFWNRNLLQAAYQYPAIWHAALALSAMQHRASVLASDGNGEFANSYLTFALKQYTKSMTCLIPVTRKSLSDSEQDMLLTTSALYTGICLLRAEPEQALTHAQNAAKLFHSWSLTTDTSDAASFPGVLGRANAVHLIRDIVHSFQSMGKLFSDEVDDQFLTPVLHTTEPFRSLDEAYYSFLSIHSGAIKIKSWAPENRRGEQVTPAPCEMLVRQHALNFWSTRFEGYLQRHDPTEEEADAIELLWLLRDLQEIFITIMVQRTPQTWASQSHKWDRIVRNAAKLMAKQGQCSNSGEPSASRFFYSVSILSVLRITGFICRDGTIRRRVIELIKICGKGDCVWTPHISWVMIEHKMLLEEAALAAAKPGTCDCVPNLFFCTEHRVSSVESWFPGEGKLSFIMKTGEDARKGLPGVMRTVRMLPETERPPRRIHSIDTVLEITHEAAG